ncbi:BON domain-containing protein [Singulisphaera sp. PoT]|uniref:BON domain-containing protein n=1 Tax=Singulisphaera sp. PoT TaxID=3411797 RepID=UPI003BF61C49
MSRHRLGILTVLSGLGLIPGFPAAAQQSIYRNLPANNPRQAAVTQERSDITLLRALQSNPVTAPYRIMTSTSKEGRVVLSGRVGTRQVHDVAVRIAIELGIPFRDDLKIDTNEVYRVASLTAPYAAGIPAMGGSPGYIYPQPLFGRLDDPFYGFEPPIISYPPWWRSVTMRESLATTPPQGNFSQGVNPAIPNPYEQPNDPAATQNGSAPVAIPMGAEGKDGTVEMTLNAQGQAVLRGTVPTLADRVAVGQKIAQTPGITEVVNLIDVQDTKTDNTPPPPPEPAAPALRELDADKPAPAGEPIEPVAENDLTARLRQVFGRRPALADLPVRITSRDGIAYLSGKVPSIYEAMLAYRAAQQTPGIKEVVDRLEFVVPDGESKNPLIQKGRPEDVEPYLAAQIRRQVGDLAHIDKVDLNGESLEIQGNIRRDEDRMRLEAILRSMPALRGYRLSTEVVVDQ